MRSLSASRAAAAAAAAAAACPKRFFLLFTFSFFFLLFECSSCCLFGRLSLSPVPEMSRCVLLVNIVVYKSRLVHGIVAMYSIYCTSLDIE